MQTLSLSRFRAQTEVCGACLCCGRQVESEHSECACLPMCVCLSDSAAQRVWVCVKEGLFLASHFFSLLLQRNAIGVRETRAGSKQSSACHTRAYPPTHTQHLAAPSNTRHGNGTAAIRGIEPFLSIEGETESEMKGRKRVGKRGEGKRSAEMSV